MKAAVPKTEKENKVRVALPDISERHQVHIINPMSGRGASGTNIYSAVEKSAAESGGEILKSERPGHIEELAAQVCAKDPFVHIIAYGGDGTVNGVADGLLRAGLQIPIGYFPSGTANDLATTLQLSRDVEKTLEIIKNGKPVPHDMGCLGGKYRFVYTASFGAFTKVSYGTSQKMKNMLGHMAYVISGASELFKLEPETISVKWDGGELCETDVLFFAVMNTHSMAGMVKIPAEQIKLSDGVLDLLIVKKPQTVAETSTLLMDLVTNHICDSKNENIIFAHSKTVEVHSKRPVAWTVDGEGTKEMSDVTVRVIPHGVRFIR